MKRIDPIDIKSAIKNGQLGTELVRSFDGYDNIILYDILDDGSKGDAVCIGTVMPPICPIGVVKEYPNGMICMTKQTYEDYKSLAVNTLIRNQEWK